MVVTRFAPSITGLMHLGTLANALVNYTYAKQHNGIFWLRLDGQHLTPEREFFQKRLVVDLEKFGLHPDFIVKQSDRKQIYINKLISLMDKNDVYYCDCKDMDIANRINTGNIYQSIERDEKYPPHYEVRRIRVCDFGGNEITVSASSNLGSKDFGIENVTQDKEFWRAYDVGYYGKEKPIIHLEFDKTWISSIKITWNSLPAKSYSIKTGDTLIYKAQKLDHFYYHKSGENVIYPSNTDKTAFTPILCDNINIYMEDYYKTIRKEYYYDNHCRNRKLELDINNAQTVVRKKCGIQDVVLLMDRQVDLILSSAIDDQEFGTTHSIRGIDIQPFTIMEGEAASLIGYKPNNLFHGMINEKGYKLSKFICSTPAVEYLNKYSVQDILNKVGMCMCMYMYMYADFIPTCKNLE